MSETVREQMLRQTIADRIEAEVRPMLDLTTEEGGYNCCGCGTYDTILDHALRIIHAPAHAMTEPEQETSA